MPIAKKTQTNADPKNPLDLARKILHYGKWKDAFEYMVNHLESPMSSTLILRGNPGTGKSSLMKEACAQCGIEPIYLNPYHYPDDISALKYLARELGIEVSDLMNYGTSIEEESPGSPIKVQNRGGRSKKKIKSERRKPNPMTVIIMLHFQEFCRQRQMLLYQLTTLTQHGENFKFIGVTHDLDCMSGLEKRVRSRINSHSYNLTYPYTNFEEYLEFSSKLVNGHEFPDDALCQLKWMYQTGCYELYILKRFLISICSWSEDGEFEVCRLGRPIFNPKCDLAFIEERLLCLTKVQLDALKLAVNYCHMNSTIEFTFEKLFERASLCRFHNFSRDLELSVKNLESLDKTFIQMYHPEDDLTPLTVFVLNIMPHQFRYVIERNEKLHSIQSDPLWKCLPSVAMAKRSNNSAKAEDSGFAI